MEYDKKSEGAAEKPELLVMLDSQEEAPEDHAKELPNKDVVAEESHYNDVISDSCDEQPEAALVVTKEAYNLYSWESLETNPQLISWEEAVKTLEENIAKALEQKNYSELPPLGSGCAIDPFMAYPWRADGKSHPAS